VLDVVAREKGGGMSKTVEQRLRDLERRITRLIQFGTVKEVDYPNKLVRVSIGKRDSAWLRFTTQRAGDDRTWWPPTEGEQVLVFAPNGNVLSAVIGDSLYQQEHDAPADKGTVRRTLMSDGAEWLYDTEAKKLTINLPGDAEINIGGNANVTVSGDATFQVSGNATATVHGNAELDAGGNVSVVADGEATVDAPQIKMNGGTGCITQESICHFTGTPHGDGSATVKAGK
jgi:phage baseplate assembly protein V